MSDLFVFADETGTMPVQGQDDPFCAATVATFGNTPAVKSRSGHLEDVLQAIDFAKVNYLLPREGYGDAVRTNTAKMNTMARANQLLNGPNPYLPAAGHNLRNLVWAHCMGPALCSAVLFGVAKGPVDRIQIVLDQKSMASPTRRMFRDTVRETIDSLRAHIAEVDRGTGRAESIWQNVRFNENDVSVTWSDESISAEWEDGLFLADRLGYHTYCSLMGKRRTLAELSAILDRFFPHDVLYDATDDIMAPAREAIERWKRNTGLPEPRE